MLSYTIQEMLLLSSPGVTELNSTDYALIDTYLDADEYSNFDYLSTQDWFNLVHTFLLLVCEAEGL